MTKKLLILILFLPIFAFSQKVHFGAATWYASKFEGRRTATGEIFRHSKLTAASNVFKFGTVVKVTNLSNNKFVLVKINDRSAKWTLRRGRIIDLSRKAARLIEMNQLEKVKVETI